MNISIYGPYRGITGYDLVVRTFIKEWYNQGHNIQTTEFTRWSAIRTQTDIDHILQETDANQLPTPDFHINFCLLDQGQLNPNSPNYIYTMFESSSICKPWVEIAKQFDGIFVPTEFNRQTFTKAGIPVHKVHVCPVPLELPRILTKQPDFHFIPFGDKSDSIFKYKCRYLNVSEFIPRKNVEGLLHAWISSTKETDDACLILKLNSNSGLKLDYLKTRFDALMKGSKKCAPIFLLVEHLSESQMLSLYQMCTHYITATFGEGWGLSESICGALGKKIIFPEATALATFLNKDNAYPVAVNTIGAQQPGPTMYYYQGSQWYAPIQFMLRKSIQQSMKDHLAGDTTKNQLVQASVINLCESFSVANSLANFAGKINPQPPVYGEFKLSPSKNNYNWLMICKSLQTKCGIADYTESLTQSMRAQKGTRCKDWIIAKGEPINYQNFIDQCHGDMNIAHIQLEYQFISPQRLEYFIKYCFRSNVVPVVTMHTVNPRVYDYHKVLKDTCCNIVVCSDKMKQTLVTECGFNENLIKVIPMGISKTNVLKSTSENGKFKLGFFGFCYFHKGIDKLIQYMSKYGHDKECFVYSTKPENDRGYFDKMAKQFQLNAVNSYWLTDYKKEEDIISELSKCDLIFLPYSEYGGVGVSAAIRTCLKSGVPIAALENSFFQDVVYDHGLVKFVGRDSNNFFEWSNGLNSFITAMKQIGVSHAKDVYSIERDKFIETYNWDNIAAMHFNYYQDLLTEVSPK